jgi:hypothetical protein
LILFKANSHAKMAPDSGVAAVYQRSRRMDARAQALAAWAAILLDDAQPANVLQFAQRADV